MARRVLIVGESGSGKTTSAATLNPEETFIINTTGKELPFNDKGYMMCDPDPSKPPEEGNHIITSDADHIVRLTKYIGTNRPDIKNIVIDDWQYVSASEFMEKLDQKGFDKFNKMGKHMWDMANIPKYLRQDLTVFYLTHSEKTRDELTGTTTHKAKTLGKLVDNVVTLEGLFTIVLFAGGTRKPDGKIEKYFITNDGDSTTAKSPMGMFDNLKIPNDLKYVKDKVENFYN